jgi:release factor glutamine methyltransferase
MSSRYIVKDVLKQLTTILGTNIPRPAREAQLLVMHILKVDELWLLTNQNTKIKETEKLLAFANTRAKNVPLEYITNKVSFYSEEFYIDDGALIPRPETELLIDEVIKNIPDKNTSITIVEVGVGSGIISIILAKKYKNAKFIAVDISSKALAVAKINIVNSGLESRIQLRLGSLLDKVSENIDYLVSNPPYIANNTKLDLNLSYEPQNALFGGNIGDEIINKLLDEVLSRKINFFTCEIGYDQKGKISSKLTNESFSSLEFYKDFSNFDRGFTLRLL